MDYSALTLNGALIVICLEALHHHHGGREDTSRSEARGCANSESTVSGESTQQRCERRAGSDYRTPRRASGEAHLSAVFGRGSGFTGEQPGEKRRKPRA